MAAEKKKNLAASVRQRLLNLSKQRREAFDLVLVRFGLERLLRPTRDADLLGSGASDPKSIAAVFAELCDVAFEDGITFDRSSVKAAEIGARIPVQIDIGFGDVVTPGAEIVRYPALLDFPAPQLGAYPVYSVIAEKFHAMVILGEANSRMKDFYDLWAIASRFGTAHFWQRRFGQPSSGARQRCLQARLLPCRATLARSEAKLPNGAHSSGATACVPTIMRWKAFRRWLAHSFSTRRPPRGKDKNSIVFGIRVVLGRRREDRAHER